MLDALNSLNSLATLGAVDNTAPASGAATSSAPLWLSGKLAQVSLILLGLLFIAAGIFSFDKTREVIVQAGKTVAAA